MNEEGNNLNINKTEKDSNINNKNGDKENKNNKKTEIGMKLNNSKKNQAPTQKSENFKINFDMNILSFFIVTKQGKVVLARQFVSMTKRELFEYCSLFARSLEFNNNQAKNSFQISDIDTTKLNNKNNHRFIYQTLYSNNLHIVLLTTDKFNLFEGLDLLKLIHRSISELCNFGSVVKNNSETEIEDEIINNVKANGYDIIMMVDDIVNPCAGKEEVNCSNIKMNLKMDSVYEKEFALMQKDKENKARDNIIKGIEEIEYLKKNNLYVNNSVSSDVYNQPSTSTSQGRLVEYTVRRQGTGLNLKERLIQRLIEQREEEMRMSTFMFACQNMIQNMLVAEMKNHMNEDDSDEDDEDTGTRTIIFAPLQIMYESGSDEDN